MFLNCPFLFFSASITQAQNSLDGHLLSKIESQHPYYAYNCEQPLSVNPMHLQNGGHDPHSLSPPHKRLKRSALASLPASVKDEVESIGDESEATQLQTPHYYGKAGSGSGTPGLNGSGQQPAGWPPGTPDHPGMDPAGMHPHHPHLPPPHPPTAFETWHAPSTPHAQHWF